MLLDARPERVETMRRCLLWAWQWCLWVSSRGRACGRLRVGAPLDGASEAQRANNSLAEGVRASTPLDGASKRSGRTSNSRQSVDGALVKMGRDLSLHAAVGPRPSGKTATRPRSTGRARRRWAAAIRRRPTLVHGADAAPGHTLPSEANLR